MRRPMVNVLELKHIVEVLDTLAPRSVVNRSLGQAGLDREMWHAGPRFIPYAPLAVLVENVARTLGDRHLGIRIGQQFKYDAYDGYAEYVLAAPYLAAALVRARKALPLIHQGSSLILKPEGDQLVIGFLGRIDTVLGYHHIEQAAPFVLSQVFLHFIGKDWHPTRIDLPAAPDSAQHLLEDMIKSPLRTGAPYTAISVDREILKTPNPNRLLVQKAIPFAELATRMGLNRTPSMRADVLQCLSTRGDGTGMSQDYVAATLGIGTRNLQRHLQQENTSFRELKTEFLSQKAKSLMRETSLPINTIASRLGYEEPNSFRRAFQQWTGMSPSQFRAQHTTQN
ncbi:AraC family transcriptional regulator ligand-binding domain-containing protein [Shimia sp. R11_0]|uniref:AraC family transcriptional regulator n=1 Tax=Shimia sp. R11_0 TaxID=2821096 RepID=UPI001AD9E2C0|nr:AraC family transcriptional regulator [Shimia sp. R11_0]MBO9476715.1 AraC family transcriptional regulator ligand-binding domain-containing protein [Shimia sp. R11_0]